MYRWCCPCRQRTYLFLMLAAVVLSVVEENCQLASWVVFIHHGEMLTLLLRFSSQSASLRVLFMASRRPSFASEKAGLHTGVLPMRGSWTPARPTDVVSAMLCSVIVGSGVQSPRRVHNFKSPQSGTSHWQELPFHVSTRGARMGNAMHWLSEAYLTVWLVQA